ncbi:pyruvate kinase [Desulforamulus ruminis]|uniref:Pyruvate kinase n=1 Tax=Desulforamulus ruminis (strain ATCC 23193 / DSM 2154 / NCIMB 8452 / DL) TaxID=696281 RepID=F6DPQ1_DESRL|nr:pyruvate kinase [Desulforamulus ruminis]AEG59628.1 pyruvate kinase [Desulforamulus ruminis DSM 2154]
MRRTKIVCTIGPASESFEVLKEMMLAGMNVARLNFSHGTHEDHGRRLEAIRQAAREVGKNIAILLDTKGPEIRLKKFANPPVLLKPGQSFTLTTREVLGDDTIVSVTYMDLPKDVRPGSRVAVADGLIEMEVEAVEGQDVHCRVINGGPLSNQKGVNLPGVNVNLPSITERDVEDIRFGIQQGVDFIAASFIRKASDVLAIRQIVEEVGADVAIIAKIESRQGVDNLAEIINVSDGIMVARGDLGVEIPAEEVPVLQKTMIQSCNIAGKPVITATQMLESMTQNPRPTRAEASDVANAIFDGSDAIMLSGETAAGKYPVQAVETMARIAQRAEQAVNFDALLETRGSALQRTVTDGISHAVCTIAKELGVSAIITATASGHTARMIAKYRPKVPIIAVTPKADVLRKLALAWGVEPLLIGPLTGTDEMISASVEVSLTAGLISAGDLVVITAGVPVGVHGTTNMMKVHTVGTLLARGTGIGQRAATGSVRICASGQEALEKVRPGDILVTAATDREFIPAMEKAAAVITEEGGLTSHAAIVGLEFGIPVVVGVDQATGILPDGEIITVDGQRGLIYGGTARVL